MYSFLGVELLRRQRTGTPASSIGGGGAAYFGPMAPPLLGNHLIANHVSFDPTSPPSMALNTAASLSELPPLHHHAQQAAKAGGGWHQQRQHATAFPPHGSVGAGVAGEWTPAGAHSPPQHSADSGFGGTAASSQQQQHGRHMLSQQQSTESAQV